MARYRRHVERTPGVRGGEPVVTGTRTPVRSIAVLYWRIYPQRIDEVQAALPHLTRAQIEAALAYYRDHRAEIDADIEHHQQALQELIAPA